MKVTMSNSAALQAVIPKADIIKRAICLGAEVRNVQLSDDLPDEAIRAINYLLLEHKVLFFRDQQSLSEVQHEHIVVRLGVLASDNKLGTTTSMQSLLHLGAGSDPRADQWHHMAVTFEGHPRVSLLRNLITPPYGIDHVWSDMAGAYRKLPLSLRMLTDQLWTVHNSIHSYAIEPHAAEGPEQRLTKVFTSTISEGEHPVVLVHPETGERVLAIGNLVQGFVGLHKYTSQKLLSLLHSYITSPENTVRWSWIQGDVAIWDSLAAQ
ncbi:TauD/TfdA dioxygenase family protein [Bradyrhizobium sp. LM2.9]